MDFLVTALMGFICKNKDLSKEDYKIYQYGLQACLEMMFCFLVCFVIALKMKMLKECILFFDIFISTRSYIGGIHMKNYWHCFTISCGVFTFVLYLTKYFIMSDMNAFLLILASISIIYYLEYSCQFNDYVSKEERNFYRNKMNIILCGWVIVFIVLIIFRLHSLLTLSAYAFLSIMFSKKAELIKNKIQK